MNLPAAKLQFVSLNYFIDKVSSFVKDLKVIFAPFKKTMD